MRPLLTPITQQAKDAYNRSDWPEAERLCHAALGADPDDFDALNLLGIIAAQTQRPQQAVASLTKAIAINPGHVMAHTNLSNVLHDLKRHEDALASCDHALDLMPDYVEGLYTRGAILRDLKRPQEALKSFDLALQFRPNDPEGLYNRGAVLRDIKHPEEALKSHDQALRIRPDFAEAWNGHGNALGDLHRIKEAVESFNHAIRIKPDFAIAHVNLAFHLLQAGDLLAGWRENEWRWLINTLEMRLPDFAQPTWIGTESLKNKTILLYGEQGLGDTLQFCRYVQMLAAMGAKVLLEVQSPLVPLLAHSAGVAQVLPKGAALPEFDYHCALMSLPLAFKTDLNTIPANIPYIHSDVVLVDKWHAMLGKKTKPRVGFVWSGSPSQGNDHNRSIALSTFSPLFCDWAECISLQKEVRESDAAFLASRKDIRHFGDALKNFADTAALVEQMDIVVTVCTSVAHLAGAMGKPVWILLAYNPCWRWLLHRENSPWYPTARLFRQSTSGDWISVINKACAALEQRYAYLPT